MGPRPPPPHTSLPPESMIVGRSRELKVLHGALDHAARKGPVTVHLVAPAGLGKTRLIAHTCDEARRRGMTVLQGTADERDRARPFAAVSDPLEQTLGEMSVNQRERLTGVDDYLGRSLRSGHLLDDQSSMLGSRGVATLLRKVLAALAARQPVVLAIDDLHWADEGSVDILASLSSRPPHAAVTLLLGYRPVPHLEALHAQRPGPSEGTGFGLIHRLELPPLQPADIAKLLPDAGVAQLRQLVETCGGNPFYLQSLYRSSVGASLDASSVGSLPFAVYAALVSELDNLDQPSRQIVNTAAVLGDPFDPGLLAAVADADARRTLEALDDMQRHNVAAPESSGRWRFRHPLLRRVAYDDQPVAARLAAHARAAAELRSRGASLPEQARHLVMSAESGDRQSAELLLDAAEQLAGQAPGQAVRWFDAALTLMPNGGRRGVTSVQLSRAEALFAVGRLDTARESVHELLANLPAGDPRRLPATRLAARIELLMGRNAESAAMLLRELNRSDRRTDGALASLYLELATTQLMGGCFVEARDAALAAREFVHPDDHLLASYAGAVVSLSTSVSEDPIPAVEEWRRAALALDGLTDAELARSLDAGVWLGWAELFLERLPDARRHLERCLAIARRGAHQHLLPHLLIGYGSVLKSLGELVAAAESYDEAAEAAAPIASRELATMTIAMQSRAATWLGDLDRAEALGVQAVRSAVDRDNWFASVAGAVLAQVRIVAGKPEGCIEAILNAGGGVELPNFDPASRCDWWEVAARAALMLDDPVRARDFADRAASCAVRLSRYSPRGYAAIADAEVLLATGSPQAAADRAQVAADCFLTAGYRIDAARADLVRGQALGAAGRRTDALEALTAAQNVFEQCEAEHLRSQARAALRRLGKRLPTGAAMRSAAADPGSGPLAVLSRREREVAALVAMGRTNRQIAAELVVSEKTVESHLGHIFTKLGVTSRAAVAGLAGTGTGPST